MELKVSSRKYECVTGRTVTEIFDFKWDAENETIEDFLIYVRYRFPNQDIRIVHGGAEVVITKKVEPKESPKKDDKMKDYKSPGYPSNEHEDDEYDDDFEKESFSKKKRGKK
jgi:hypothetical protein